MTAQNEADTGIGSILTKADPDSRSGAHEALRTKRVTVQLSERTFERLEAATDRPGLGKSMVIEAALERFLDPAPPVAGIVQESFDRIDSRLERLEYEIAIIAETVALHARYHLTVTPPMSQPQQHEACVLGHARFKALAEQVDSRVRQGHPLMRETIAYLAAARADASRLESNAEISLGSAEVDQEILAASAPKAEADLSAAGEEDGSNRNFRHLPNAFC
ncbi:MAG: hypothetical protein HY852_19320 [Bradyrhizobium sp.]|uniref:hypothetical protein n=1 Tax=Bradyrhizobium sp. TaxID=376 RepID=UPI0025C5EA10|nr:hypothetical protein [Bradyrhizobium sp.]MBI5263964.1 hypothetical protein [Bradyrhizobium sp.]